MMAGRRRGSRFRLILGRTSHSVSAIDAQWSSFVPMTTRMSYYDGTVTGDEIAYYGMRTGAVGMFITGVVYSAQRQVLDRGIKRR